MMRYFYIQVLVAVMLLQAGCHRPANSSAQTKPLLTDKEVIAIADEEIKRRGLDKKYGFDFDEIHKVSTRVYIDVLFADELCSFTLDENGGIINNKCEHTDMYSFMKQPGSTVLRNKEEAHLYFEDWCKKRLPEKEMKRLFCSYFPKGWWVSYRDMGFLGHGAYFTVIVREDSEVDQIMFGK
ncbi:MAG: hypothetical protein ABFD91_19190 [Anaerohalosphaeraceae bacterium]